MNRVLGEIVKFQNNTGLYLHGMLYGNPLFSTTVIHIHGSYGNFYTNYFLNTMASTYNTNQINLLTFNLTCHDGFAEGYWDNEHMEYVGGAVSDFMTCVDDIYAAVKFAEKFSNEIILQGHSLGCERVLTYLLNDQTQHDFILLSPGDSYGLQSRWIEPETINEQIIRLQENSLYTDKEHKEYAEWDWLPLKEYGLREDNDWTYPLPITRNAFLSIIASSAFELIRIENPTLYYIAQKAFIYIGGEDSIQIHPSNKMFEFFKKRIKDVAPFYLSHGNHMLSSCEQEVAKEIVEWIQNKPLK